MDNVPELIRNIYQVFIDYFGENRVDLQLYNSSNIIQMDSAGQETGDYLILVKWDEVTITNEYEESIDIWGLYCVTTITPRGKMRRAPGFTRSTYDDIQWSSNYCHSHVPSLNHSNCAMFRYSCLGTGPIRETIERLKGAASNDLDIWRLYCWELDKYVHVESLTGGPYRRLREVGKNSENSFNSFKVSFKFPYPASRICKSFTKELIKIILENNVLKYNFSDGRYLIAMTYPEAVMSISNAFINWYNLYPEIYKVYKKEQLYGNKFLEKAFIQNGSIIRERGNSENAPIDIGRRLFYFKGETITLQSIYNNKDYNAGEVTIVNTEILDYIIYVILKYLNIHYGESTDSTNQTTRIV